MEEIATTEPAKAKRKFKRFHQERCGNGRAEYDSYEDVKEACERRLLQWERDGILVPWSVSRSNDWLFGHAE